MKCEVEDMLVFYRGLHLTQTMRSKWRLTLGTFDLRNYPTGLAPGITWIWFHFGIFYVDCATVVC